MIAVIFEVEPAQGDPKPYLDIAATLIDELKAIDGFISVERFQSLSTPGKLLSLSFWRDEDAVRRWRSLESHRRAQAPAAAACSRTIGCAWRRCCGLWHGAARRSPGDSRERHG